MTKTMRLNRNRKDIGFTPARKATLSLFCWVVGQNQVKILTSIQHDVSGMTINRENSGNNRRDKHGANSKFQGNGFG